MKEHPELPQLPIPEKAHPVLGNHRPEGERMTDERMRHRCGARHRSTQTLVACERPSWAVSGTGPWLVFGCNTVRLEQNIADALLCAQEPCGPRCVDPWLHGLLIASLENQHILIVDIQKLSISLESLKETS